MPTDPSLDQAGEFIAEVQAVVDVTSTDGATLVALGLLDELPQPTPNP
ncbi:hypothetical protein HHL19_16730 [Streptomyces sp. R302]|nr:MULTISPECIES: hypothetical protein [unclassified Streptomyces]NML55415.1 hypothetical protein [Streptomyces sp. R301]NML80287.1 hypothetical protein [Streptomyces sp. R302]